VSKVPELSHQLPAGEVSAEVTLRLPYHILVDGRWFRVRMPKYDSQVRFEAQRAQGLTNVGLESAQGVELERDRRGLLRRSSAIVRLPGAAAFGAGAQVLPGEAEIIAAALEIVNRFVDTFRALSGEFHLRRLSQTDLLGMASASVDWYRGGSYVRSGAVMSFPGGLILERVPPADEFHRELQQRLETLSGAPLHAELLMNAKDYLDVGDLRMAVVEARTAVEVFVDNLLDAQFEQQNTDLATVCSTLRLRSEAAARVKSSREAIAEATINNKLKYGLRRALGRSPADDTTLWKKWLAAKRLRENVVHYGQPVANADAEAHVEVAEKIISGFGGSTVSTHWQVKYIQKGQVVTDWLTGTA
jgi:hypothetical protein